MAIPKLRRDKNQFYTVEEYLKIDRASQERYEYYDGEIRLMAGESDKHGDYFDKFNHRAWQPT